MPYPLVAVVVTLSRRVGSFKTAGGTGVSRGGPNHQEVEERKHQVFERIAEGCHRGATVREL
jgi:hypothetical protein